MLWPTIRSLLLFFDSKSTASKSKPTACSSFLATHRSRSKSHLQGMKVRTMTKSRWSIRTRNQSMRTRSTRHAQSCVPPAPSCLVLTRIRNAELVFAVHERKDRESMVIIESLLPACFGTILSLDWSGSVHVVTWHAPPAGPTGLKLKYPPHHCLPRLLLLAVTLLILPF